MHTERTAQHLVTRVHAFHLKQHLWVCQGPKPEVQVMRTHLIMEETAELLLALHNSNEEKFVDGLGDLMYVTAGSWVSIFGTRIQAMTVKRPNERAPKRAALIDSVLDHVSSINSWLFLSRVHHWDEKTIRELISKSIVLCADAGYDPMAVFDAIADSNDTKWYKEENGQRVKDKGPDFRTPVLTPLLRGW